MLWMALHNIILFELLLWIQNWNQREFCIPFGSRISNIYSWILFCMQHTNDVQLLRSLHEKKKFYRKTYHFKFSLECAHVHVHLHDCLSSSSIFFSVKIIWHYHFNHYSYIWDGLAFSLFSFSIRPQEHRIEFGKIAWSVHKNQQNHFTFLLTQFNLIQLKRKIWKKKNLGSSTVTWNALTKEKEHHYKHSTK